MIKKKLSLNEVYNIIILILILAVIFSSAKLFLYKDLILAANNQSTITPVHDRNAFFFQVIHHVFPAQEVKHMNGSGFQLRDLPNSFIHKVFEIDLKKPITFVQAQFPAFQLYKDHLSAKAEIPKGVDEGESEFNFYFLDYEKEKEIIASGNNIDVEQNRDSLQDQDDLGELQEGIYLIGEENIIDSLNNSGSISLENVEKPEKIQFQKGKPDILIYHTHGTESYRPASEGNYHTLRKEYSVITVGEIIATELEKRGFQVIHDTTYHDYPSYSGSYSRSLATAKKILDDNPSIKVVLDIHRDGYDHVDSNPNYQKIIENNRVTINNEVCSRFMLVIGSETPNRREVETFAKFIKAVSDSKYSDFSKPIMVKPYGRFNQFLSDHYALIEVGSNANTIEEAKRAAVYLADVLAESLHLLRKN